MKKSLQIVGAAALAAGVAVGVTTAVAAGQTQPRAATNTVATTALAPPTYQPDSEAKFVPITPCRIVDTRIGTGTNGTPFANLNTRTYYVGGTFGFAPQGGVSGGCGVPVGAVSVSAIITAVGPSHPGYLRVWSNGSTEPNSTILNYATVSTGTGFTATINAGSAYSMKVRNYGGPTEVVIDILGYSVKPLAGFISPSGAPYAGSSRIVSATQIGTGVYEVQFNRNIRYCAAVTTVYVSNYYSSVTTWYDSARPDTARVYVWDNAGAAVDQYFYIQVQC
jgi:hypothetical protein